MAQLRRAMNNPDIDWPYDEDEWTDDEVVDLVDSPVSADDGPGEPAVPPGQAQRPAVPSRYPQPPTVDDLPGVTEEEQLIVEMWRAGAEAQLRDEINALYEERPADGMLPHLLNFMKHHPGLVIQLGVEDEYIFHVSDQRNRIGKWEGFTELLLRLREEHPLLYALKYGYFDYDLMVGLMLTGRKNQMSNCFNLFHQYPDSDPGNASRVADLLAWTGMQEELFAFVRPLAIPMRETHGDAGAFAMQWRLFSEYPALLTSGAEPAAAAAHVMAVDESLHGRMRLDPDLLRREFEILRQPREIPAYAACRTQQAVTAFYREVEWNFAAYLHTDKAFPLVRARLLSRKIGDFIQLRPEGAKLKYPFRVPCERFEIFLCGDRADPSEVDGIIVAPIVDALWYFADFLEARSLDDGEDIENLRELSLRGFHMLHTDSPFNTIRCPTARLLPKPGEALLSEALADK